jgi:hypothetical protein
MPKTAEGRPTRQNAPNLFLDGDTLAVFEQVPWREQHAAAASAGLTRDEALLHLRRLMERTAFL